jgi:hypothetical protein
VSGSNLYASLSSLLAAAVAIAIGISVFLRDRSRDQFRLFAGFCLNLGLFHLARFFAGFPASRSRSGSPRPSRSSSLTPPTAASPASSPPPAPRPATSCRRRCSPSC